MRKRFILKNAAFFTLTGAFLLTTIPVTAQTSSPRGRGVPAPYQRADRPNRSTPANPPAQNNTTQKVQQPTDARPYRGHQTWQGYQPPVYPGPNAPLPPQGTYYYPSPYYGYGYNQQNGYGYGYQPYANYQYSPGPRVNGGYQPYQGYYR